MDAAVFLCFLCNRTVWEFVRTQKVWLLAYTHTQYSYTTWTVRVRSHYSAMAVVDFITILTEFTHGSIERHLFTCRSWLQVVVDWVLSYSRTLRCTYLQWMPVCCICYCQLCNQDNNKNWIQFTPYCRCASMPAAAFIASYRKLKWNKMTKMATNNLIKIACHKYEHEE